MAEYAGNEGYEVVYYMIDGVLVGKSGNYDTLAELSSAYKKPNDQEPNDQEPNYNEERYREAYLYLYSPMFSYATSKILNIFAGDLKQQLEVKDKETLNVCCIGGGPATELLVLINVLERLGIRPSSVNCTVLDKYTAWQGTWDKLWETRQYMGEPVVDVSMTYVGCDLSQDISKEAKSAIQGADVVTHFMAYSRLESAHSHASILGNMMKEKSTLVYIESTRYDQRHPKTMRDRFLEELPGGFDVLSSVENEFCKSKEGLLFQTFSGMTSYWGSTFDDIRNKQYGQMTKITVSALILNKKVSERRRRRRKPDVFSDTNGVKMRRKSDVHP